MSAENPVSDQIIEQRERPILMSGPMVRALLDGRKTQTRRVCTPAMAAALSFVTPTDHGTGWFGDEEGDVAFRCPYGVFGDRLWVRETWRWVCPDDPDTAIYRADGHTASALPPGFKWKPAIHMPRAASRITLELTDVRVQRLQDITPEDAIAEGLTRRAGVLETWWGNGFDGDTPSDDACYFLSPVECYRALWDQINGAGSWDANPWIWALTFKRRA